MAEAGSGKLPIIECVVTAVRFFADNWRRFAPAALIISAVVALWPLLNLGAPAEGQSASVLQTALVNIIDALPGLIGGLFFSAAVLRFAIRGEFIGPTGLVASADEGRLAGVLGSMALFFIPPVLLFATILSMTVLSRLAATPEELQILLDDPEKMSEALQVALGDTGMAALSLFIIVIFVLALVVMARLFMVNAATIGERRIVLFQTWGWSRGNVWRMIGAILMIGVPVMLVGNILQEAVISMLLSMPPEQRMLPATIGSFVLAFVSAMASIPLIALGAHFYKGLRPPDFQPK